MASLIKYKAGRVTKPVNIDVLASTYVSNAPDQQGPYLLDIGVTCLDYNGTFDVKLGPNQLVAAAEVEVIGQPSGANFRGMVNPQIQGLALSANERIVLNICMPDGGAAWYEVRISK